MKGWQRILLFSTALFFINIVTWWVVETNAMNHIYPSDGDSIAIPFFSTIIGSIVVLPILIIISFVPGTQFIKQLVTRGFGWSVIIGLALLPLYASCVFFGIIGFAYWAVPNHYLIALCYLILLLALAVCFWFDGKRLISNPALKRDCAKSGAAP